MLERAYSDLLKLLLATGKLEILFHPRFISLADLKDAVKPAMAEPDEPRNRTQTEFGKIEEVSRQKNEDSAAPEIQ